MFLIASGVLVNAQRSFLNSLVERTTTQQRSAAIGGLISIHALSNGVLQLPDWGLESFDRNDPEAKTAAIYVIPYLVLAGKGDALLSQAGAMLNKSVYLNNKLRKVEIENKLQQNCSIAKDAHAEYFAKTKPIMDMSLGKDIAIKKFIEFRDKRLGYEGTLQIGMPYNEFIRHIDIQIAIRQKLMDMIDEYSMSAQLQYILPKSKVKTYLMQFFDRKFIDPCMSWDDYVKEYLIAIGKDLGQKTEGVVVSGDWSDVPNKNVIDEIGRKAIYAAIAPPSGIAWTLIAACIATALVGYRLATMATGKAMAGFVVAGLILYSAWILPFQSSNKFLDNPAIEAGFTRMSDDYGQLGAPIASLLEWSMRAAPIVYPYGKLSRQSGVGALLGLNAVI